MGEALTLASDYTLGQSIQQIVLLTFLPGSDSVVMLRFYWVKAGCMVFPYVGLSLVSS